MQQGYHGTGLKEILDAVRIPKGSFYNYFGSKESFAAEIIAHYIKPYLEQLQGYLAQYEGNALAALSSLYTSVSKPVIPAWMPE
jgi:TetR/AcrR family transcriptional regulator, transcriptional repressor for nem operon